MERVRSAPIPESHVDLLTDPVVVTLVTVMPDGQPQATPVWTHWDGEHIIVNTARGRQKDQNMQQRSKVTVLAIDPQNPYRWMEVRGEIESQTEADGLDWINRLAKKYKGVDEYYGNSAPASLKHREQRVTYRVRPTHVTKGG